MNNKKVYLTYVDGIDLKRVKALIGAVNEVSSKFKPDTLCLLLSSPGGEVNPGITLYNFLKAIPPKIVTYNIGAIDSISTVVFLAGAERYAASNTSFLFHGVASRFSQNSQLTLHQMKERLSGLEEDQNKILRIICDSTDLREEELENLFVQGEAKNAKFAKERGIIHDIQNPVISPDDISITVNIN